MITLFFIICITIYYKYVTIRQTINLNALVTIQKIISAFQGHTFKGTESKGRVHFLLNLSILSVLTHSYFSVSYLILTTHIFLAMISVIKRLWFHMGGFSMAKPDLQQRKVNICYQIQMPRAFLHQNHPFKQGIIFLVFG